MAPRVVRGVFCMSEEAKRSPCKGASGIISENPHKEKVS